MNLFSALCRQKLRLSSLLPLPSVLPPCRAFYFVWVSCPNEGKWESREHDNNANGMEKIHRGWKKKWPMQDRVKRLKVMLSQWQTRSIMFVAASVLTLGFVPDDV